MFIHSLKKLKERKQISTVNDVFRYSLNMQWLSGKTLIKTLQARQQAKKAPDEWSQHETTQKKQTRKINKFELLFILVMMTGSLSLVL